MGLEPTRGVTPPNFESGASTNSAISAHHASITKLPHKATRFRTLCLVEFMVVVMSKSIWYPETRIMPKSEGICAK